MKLFKGWFGEKKTAFNMWVSLNSNIYHRFHDVIILTNNGTTQIDHILISEYGIFIVETKNLQGWIFGSEKNAKWTQTLAGNKYPFQNPLRQTYRQKKVLAEFLNISDSMIYDVVFFVGDCKLKTEMPSNVLVSGLGRYIKRFKSIILSKLEVDKITEQIHRYKQESNLSTKDHIRSLRERHNSTTVCPRCGYGLIKRLSKNGRNAGSEFLGCSNFPKCRFAKSK